jgi:hypothetical protein
MKHTDKRARGAIAVLAALGLALAVPTPSFADDEPDYSSLEFDSDAAYQGRFTDSGLTFDTYQVTYVTDPIAAFPDHFKLNIKVPVSYNDVVFDPAAVASGPILATNPWGGDNGAPVPAVGTIAGGNTQAMRTAWMTQGNVTVEVGMRGKGQISDGINYGKMPAPFVDMKSAIRYLHFNTDLIPGDERKIFFSGFSSGGDGAAVIGAAGNTTLFDEYFDEIGAYTGPDARDDVFAVVVGSPAMARGTIWSETRIWQLMYDRNKTAAQNIADLKAVSPVNGLMLEQFVNWLNDKGITATVDGVTGTPLTPDTLDDYMLPYLEASADAAGNATWDREWESFWINHSGNSANDRNPATPGPFEADQFFTGTILADGVRSGGALSQGSFGARTAPGSVFSEVGLDWIQNHSAAPVAVSEEAEELLVFQRNATDPFYFVLGDNVADGDVAADVAPNWFIRAGAADAPLSIGMQAILNATLEDEGYNSQLVWDWGIGHAGATVFNAASSAQILEWADARVAEFEAKVISATPEASVKVGAGNTNLLTVTVTEVNYFGDEKKLVEEFSIRNNASGSYQVGPYSVFVDTKGNDQIREIYIAE